MARLSLLVIILSFTFSGCSIEKLYKMRQRHKIYAHEQIDFTKMMNLYMNKSHPSSGSVEGIYSVSGLVTKRGKGLLASEEKEKVVDRKENYAKVAVVRDNGNANREYIEILMDRDFAPSFSIVGEFSGVSDGNILVYKHFEPKGQSTTFTFSYDAAKDILEGVRTENNGNFTFTYKLTYLKILPKAKLDF